ncbi:L-asparaginase [Aureobasidium pullulans]|uniref:asparaginase n=1 Tax=Aureobasidium pullulans TaxID=5580 RepID=A0A4S9ZH06_AURPU|nr:L-asparaginase [Aureobasidium pullulans]TIA06451.1 L-asparaginase [Aureobasidium pullulans]
MSLPILTWLVFTLSITGACATSAEYTTPNFNQTLSNVTIFTTGGTIAEAGSSATQTTNYGTPNSTFDELLAAVPELAQIANVKGSAVASVDSQNINSTILLDLALRITVELSKVDVQGVVVTHGSDTLEETAFFLDLTINSTKPVVVVGSMRPSSALSADGPLNLYQAVKLAASASARGRGTMVTLNDRISSAYYVSKTNANALDTFIAKEQGQLGFFLNQIPIFYYEKSTPYGKPNFNASSLVQLPKVDILYAHIDMDPALVNASIAAGAKGIVFAGTGAGNVPTTVEERARVMNSECGVPMVFTTRTMNGFVPRSDTESWEIAGADLNPQKARILLQLALSDAPGMDEVASLFNPLQPY